MSEEHSQQRDTALAEWRESAAHWGKHARTIRTMFTPITDALIQEASIRRGAKVLDVAAGPGEPSLSIAEFVGAEGCVVSSDAIGGMVAAGFKEAQRRHVKNISFAQCEAGALPFADSSFDSVVSRLGAMFFPDIGEALREMCRVNRPGGSISLVVWGKSEANPFSFAVSDVVARFVPSQPTAACAHDAFRFAEPGVLSSLLSEAGTFGVHERLLRFNIEAPIDFTNFWAMRSQTSGTLREKLASVSADQRSQIASEVEAATKQFFLGDQMKFPAEMIIVTGHRSV